ncbi:MAG: hypothetical protein ACRDWI_19015 [Jiangellaceae bacterium]
MPADRARDGEFIRLHEEAQANIRALIEEAAADPAADDDRRKIGDLYASFADEAAVETRGGAPLLPLLERISALRDVDGPVTVLSWSATPSGTSSTSSRPASGCPTSRTTASTRSPTSARPT